MPEHTVKQGDCIESVAYKYGHFWETVWNDAGNAELKKRRKDHNLLFPGEKVFVPEKRIKGESCATEQWHQFRRKGVPSRLRLKILDDDEPRANEPYTIEVNGQWFSGTTDAEGRLEQAIPPNTKFGRLLVGADQDEYPLNLGYVDPIDEISGVQERLNNLGFDCGTADGMLNAETRKALSEFQKKYYLEEMGNLDEPTRAKLQEVYGC